jgi:hypothetical protein
LKRTSKKLLFSFLAFVHLSKRYLPITSKE